MDFEKYKKDNILLNSIIVKEEYVVEENNTSIHFNPVEEDEEISFPDPPQLQPTMPIIKTEPTESLNQSHYPGNVSSATYPEEYFDRFEITIIPDPEEDASGTNFQDILGSRECSICFMKFNYMSHLMSHMQVHLENRPVNECDICGKIYKWKKDLNRHKRNQHTATSTLEATARIAGAVQSEAEPGPEAAFRGNLSTRTCNVKQEPEEPKMISQEAAADEKYECSVCFKIFRGVKGKESLRQHMRVHKRTKLYPCDSCGKVFKWKHDATRHSRQCKKDKKSTFPCSICGISCPSATILQQHTAVCGSIQKIEQKKYKCQICGKLLKNRACLRSHMTIHEESRPTFPCELCGQVFKWQKDMKRHYRKICKIKHEKATLSSDQTIVGGGDTKQLKDHATS
uniref:C2H2-type domain-containing protein n=1 Tax=Lutzomyia longipalpis TaxID=7200 RepID=A0A1B0CDT2_LUTLO